MNKHDINRNLPMLNKSLSCCGYDRWLQTFFGTNQKTGERKHFFVEYCIVNQGLGREFPIMGDKPHQKPSYLQVRVGHWGKKPLEIERYFGIDEMEKADTFLKISAGDCFLSENNIWGRVSGEHNMMWSIKLDKRISFHVGYSAGKLIRELNPFDMYWHTEGMKTYCEGMVILDGETYKVERKNSCGYADKKWGREHTAPWFFIHANQCKSTRYKEELNRSAFAMGGGNPVVFGIPFKDKPYIQFYYEESNYEINFSKLWTFAKMKYKYKEKDGKLYWHVKAVNNMTALDIQVECPTDELLDTNYQNPCGLYEDNVINSGGTGRGKIILYKRQGKDMVLVDRILIRGVGLEYIKS